MIFQLADIFSSIFGGGGTEGIGPVASGSDYASSLGDSSGGGGFWPGIFSNIFGGKSGGNLLAALGTAGIGAYGAANTANIAHEDTLANQAFAASEAEKNRVAEQAALLQKLAAEKEIAGIGASGQAGANAVAKLNVKRQMVADATSAHESGATLKANALALFLKGILGGYGK